MENFVISNTDFVQIKLLKINSVIYLPFNKKANKMNGEHKGNGVLERTEKGSQIVKQNLQ